MQPAFVSDQVWSAIPDDVRVTILEDASSALRRGEQDRVAVWRAVSEHLGQTLYDYFDVERTEGEFAWPLIFRGPEGRPPEFVAEVLMAYWVTGEDEVELSHVISTMDAEAAWLELAPSYPDEVCNFCGHDLAFETMQSDELCIHARCDAGYRELKRVLFQKLVRRAEDLGLMSAAPASTSDERSPVEHNARVNSSPEEISEAPALSSCRRDLPNVDESVETLSVDELLGEFEGELIEVPADATDT